MVCATAQPVKHQRANKQRIAPEDNKLCHCFTAAPVLRSRTADGGRSAAPYLSIGKFTFSFPNSGFSTLMVIDRTGNGSRDARPTDRQDLSQSGKPADWITKAHF